MPTPGYVDFHVNTYILASGQWDTHILLSLVPPYIVSRISIYIPSETQSDFLIWGLTADGEYSVKSGALLAQGLLPSSMEKVEYN